MNKDKVLSIKDLIGSLPQVEGTEGTEEEIERMYNRVMISMEKYDFDGRDIELGFRPFCTAGKQHTSHFWVKDLGKKVEGSYNWHGQETSQWLFAGCILVHDNTVSSHT